MKKALVLGVMAIFAISMNVQAQDRTASDPKPASKARPAATIKTSEKKDDVKVVEIKKEEQKVEEKVVDPKGNNDARTSEIKKDEAKKGMIKKESKDAVKGSAVSTKTTGKSTLKTAPAGTDKKVQKESLKPKTLKTAKDTPKSASQTSNKKR